jgi:hypothetical protein
MSQIKLFWYLVTAERRLENNMNSDRGHHCKRFERSFFLQFSDNLADVFDFLTLQDMHNMPALSINIKISCTAAKQIRQKSLFLVLL